MSRPAKEPENASVAEQYEKRAKVFVAALQRRLKKEGYLLKDAELHGLQTCVVRVSRVGSASTQKGPLIESRTPIRFDAGNRGERRFEPEKLRTYATSDVFCGKVFHDIMRAARASAEKAAKPCKSSTRKRAKRSATAR